MVYNYRRKMEEISQEHLRKTRTVVRIELVREGWEVIEGLDVIPVEAIIRLNSLCGQIFDACLEDGIDEYFESPRAYGNFVEMAETIESELRSVL